MAAWALLPALAIAPLFGCAVWSTVPMDQSTGQGHIATFVLSGRLSVRQAQHQDVVRLDWQHGPGEDHLALSTPLGGQVMQLDSLPGHARLQLPQRDAVDAADPESLMQSMLGYALPVRDLAAWVSGQIPPPAAGPTSAQPPSEVAAGPAPLQGAAAVGAPPAAADHDAVQFAQDGWTGTLERWRLVGDSRLPGLVTVARGTLTLRLVVDQWQVERHGL